ncbi:MAG: ATP-binding cassette domain-containing protein [Clostridium sp.]|jgi:putative ABC transport system ATP-binding protein|uniref:ABC transporter ATP-binding protein n=1 Tax=Clostridium sp. TaxID=1506 RepID=UPI0025BC3D70|nr:ATP-binding cassette domain-containing protein [Clostridium sp.]MCH3963622.1 ATP-binding cassette domain-containing protein [Clostridium sp.]MCI1714763.1 ATP-binding cassette domain-containing protein [Clostridium sp.]MCI1799048.1 ATP-binding cassette domain-containing protein [Clostridium sp.]MCI1812946.1 ATP-binding cassette domain-containing protein [Clostridium sp.]MCI1869836.1 ATP-binding cassette domain-containing protein [Clostridium sp.]
MTLLEFKNVSYISDNKYILKNLSLEINHKDFISIVGPSGSGKSTFFRLCSQLISPTSGNIFYKGMSYNKYDPKEWRKQIAYCFQTPCFFENTVIDNLKFPFSIRNKEVNLIRIKELLEEFNMSTEYLSRKIDTLSGGEKQRISLIRSLIFSPEILLLDEATSALDEKNTSTVENVIRSLNERGITILWITHSPEQSKKYANRILTIECGELKSLEDIK